MWIQEFTSAIEKLKRDVETISLQIDITIDSYQMGREDPKIVPHFWIAIESLLASREQKRVKGEDEGVQDFATIEIMRLLFLKQDPKGWAILSKGKNVKLLGHGESMSRTVEDFRLWHVRLNEEVNFDEAFKEYYERTMVKIIPQICEHIEISNHPSDVLAHIPCQCGRPMEVASVNYRCFHGLEPSLLHSEAEYSTKCGINVEHRMEPGPTEIMTQIEESRKQSAEEKNTRSRERTDRGHSGCEESDEGDEQREEKESKRNTNKDKGKGLEVKEEIESEDEYMMLINTAEVDPRSFKMKEKVQKGESSKMRKHNERGDLTNSTKTQQRRQRLAIHTLSIFTSENGIEKSNIHTPMLFAHIQIPT